MERSFLTFSPKVLSRKKTSKQTTSSKLKLKKPGDLPLQEVGSPSNLKNFEKKNKLCNNALEDESIVILDDSTSPCRSNVQKTTISNQKSPFAKSHALSLSCSTNYLYRKNDTNIHNDNSPSRDVLKYQTVHSKVNKRTSNESFDKIKQWLDKLHDIHQQKMYDPVWSTPRSEAGSSSGNSCTFINNSFKLRVSETDSDRSSDGISSSSPLPLPNTNSFQLHAECNTLQTPKEDSLKLRISETSSDSSVILLPSESCLLSKESVQKNICKKLSLSGSSEDSIKPVSRNRVNITSYKESEYSNFPPSSASNSSSNLSLTQELSDAQHNTSNAITSGCNGRVSVLSTCSKSSTNRILTELYTKELDVKAVITPKGKEKKSRNLQQFPSKTNGSIDELLTQVYGNTWCKDSVLTPVVNRKKRLGVKDKENTPPVNRLVLPTKSKSSGRSKLVSPCTIPETNKTLSFLKSLSASPSSDVCDPIANLFKKQFKKKKDSLVLELFQLYNCEVFDNKLPSTLKIEWNVRLTRTAGFCRNRWIMQTQGKVRSSLIELSTKVCNTPDRVRDTLIHELCHAAAWIIDGVKTGHGPQWKKWARKAMQKFPELPKIDRCHNYSIETKFVYRCKSCGYSVGRHSKSLDLQRKRCGYCYGEFELFLNDKTSKTNTGVPSTPRTPRAASGFALYVKENYKTVKEKNADLKHAAVMKLLGNQFASMKVDSAV